MSKSENSSQTIDELRERYEELNSKRIVFQTKRDAALEQLNELKASAMESYGTDDVDLLQKKLAELKSENEIQRKTYQESLDRIESQLGEIQEEFDEELVEE